MKIPKMIIIIAATLSTSLMASDNNLEQPNNNKINWGTTADKTLKFIPQKVPGMPPVAYMAAAPFIAVGKNIQAYNNIKKSKNNIEKIQQELNKEKK